jgi:protein ImuB
MSLAEARGLCAAARVLPLDPAHSLRCLTRLAEWAMRFSPMVAVDPVATGETVPGPEGLLLDVTGTAHLFGGEPLMLAEMAARLRRLGFSSRLCIAPTVGAAWALARHGPATLSFLPEERTTAALSPLAVAALRLPRGICSSLADVGIERVAHLLALPRESLLVRYGEEVLLRLDQAFGRMEERIEPIRPAEPMAVSRAFEGATTQLEAVMLTVQELLAELTKQLREKESGTRGVRVELYRMNDPPVSREIVLGRPSRQVKHLWSLLRPKVESMHLGHGVEAVALTATWIERIRHGQEAIWGDAADAQDEQVFGAFVDTLVNRWGERRVLTPLPAASHVPEEAYRLVPATQVAAVARDSPPELPWVDRPPHLLEQPEPADAVALQPDHPPRWLRWRGEGRPVRQGIGPERIVAHGTRDYFKVQWENGLWLWAYRVLETGEWFVHGLWA